MKNKNKTKLKQAGIGKVILINPKRELKKGAKAKKVSMDRLVPFSKKVSGYEISKYKGGSRFINGDTLLARITPCLENGKTSYVDFLEEGEVGFGSTEFMVLSGKEGETVNDFVFYLAISPRFRKQAITSMTGTSGRQRVQRDFLEAKEIEIPSLPEQKSIAHILSTLDEKIELLQKQNKTLEEIGQAIFKRWFVDDPNKKGWEEGYFNDNVLTELIKPGIDKFKGEKIYLPTANVSDSIINDYSYKITFEERPSRAGMQPQENTIWFAKMKESPKRQLFLEREKWRINNLILSTGFAGIKPKKEALFYIWNIINSKSFETQKDNLAMGTTMQAINNKNIEKIKYFIPDKETLSNFNKLVKPLYYKISTNNQQIQTLSQIRDSLLPKLMSGKIRVPVEDR